LVGLQRRRREQVFAYIERATGPWIDCPAGITASEMTTPPKTQVQEVSSDRPGVRIFVVQSEERLAYERAMRERSMQRTREALEKLKERISKGHLKTPEKIGEAAARILARNHGHRYYGWELKKEVFEFFEHPVYLKRERAYEGKYVIQTEERNLSPVEAVRAYKELSDVERGFREMKDIIEMRPIFHRKKERVQAHIFVAALAFLLDRALEKKLKAAHVQMSSPQALEALATVHVVDIKVDDSHKRGVTAGSARARDVLSALAITDHEPPKLAKGEKATTC
jgi:transposase